MIKYNQSQKVTIIKTYINEKKSLLFTNKSSKIKKMNSTINKETKLVKLWEKGQQFTK